MSAETGNFTEDCVLGKEKKALKSFSTSLIGMAQKRRGGLAHGTPRCTGQKRPGRLASLFQTLTETAWGGAQNIQGKDSLFLKTGQQCSPSHRLLCTWPSPSPDSVTDPQNMEGMTASHFPG